MQPRRDREIISTSRSGDHDSTERSGAHAFQLFCTPALSSHRTADHEQLVERARFHLRAMTKARVVTSVGEIQVYVAMPETPPQASVLLVHGWTAEAAFMTAMAEHLRRRSMRVVLMDLPAHGNSSGETTTLIDCGQAVLEVAEAMGPIRFVLGHSMGGLAALLAGEGRRPLPRSAPFEGYVLIGMPDRFGEVTRNFGNKLGLSAAALRAFERRLEMLALRRVADFSGSGLLSFVQRPALLLHCRDDEVARFAAAEEMARVSPNVELQDFSGLGHRMILYAPPAARAASAFFMRLLAK